MFDPEQKQTNKFLNEENSSTKQEARNKYR